MTLYEINENWGVIGEVGRYSPRILIGDASIMIDENLTMSLDYYGNSYLRWPNISVEMVNVWEDNDNGYSLDTAVVMEASDVLGNFEEEYIVVNDNTTYNTWTPAQSNNTMMPQTSTEGSMMPQTSMSGTGMTGGAMSTLDTTQMGMGNESMISTMEATSGNHNTGAGSSSNEDTGLDAVSGGAWLAIVLVLSAALIIVSVLFCREKSMRADNAMRRGGGKDDGYLQMT